MCCNLNKGKQLSGRGEQRDEEMKERARVEVGREGKNGTLDIGEEERQGEEG